MNYVVVLVLSVLLAGWVHLIYRWRITRPERPREHVALLLGLVVGFIAWAFCALRICPVDKTFAVAASVAVIAPNMLWLHRRRSEKIRNNGDAEHHV